MRWTLIKKDILFLPWCRVKLSDKACPSDAEGVGAIASLSAPVHNHLGLNSLITCFSLFTLFTLSVLLLLMWWLSGGLPAYLFVRSERRYQWYALKLGFEGMHVWLGVRFEWGDGYCICVCSSVCICRGCTLFASGWWRASYAHWSDRGLMFN